LVSNAVLVRQRALRLQARDAHTVEISAMS
jgi:hypothetical protein